MPKDSDKQAQELEAMRHSMAHIMATAIKHLWPEVKFGVGPAVENGFYYDIDLGEKALSEDDLAKIEAEMKRVIADDQKFEQFDLHIDEALSWAKEMDQQYKHELLNDLKRSGTTVAKDLDRDELGTITDGDSQVETVSFYKNGPFTDLCRGPHVPSTGKAGAFKLMRISGAYWRGKEDNPQMQRIYGVAFATEKELRQHLNMLEEAKKRDHRKLGQELDLFVFSPLVGSGLPMFTPRGATLRNLLAEYSLELKQRLGFEEVWVPHITKKELYEASGHWDKFGDELFLVKSQETSDEMVMKPMNCPHHTQLYASKPRSYRDLPIRYMENTTVYRDEKSGELHGLERVRSITQDDSHAFCTEKQVREVVEGLIEVVSEMYEVLSMPPKRIHLSFRNNEDKYLGDQKLWDRAQKTLENLAVSNKLNYKVDEGEAAFYGPKIDFIAEDSLGRETQVATIQLDFVQPERFGLEYADENGGKSQPVMIHCALLGSIERFLSVYIEHTAGKFPVWLAPEQIRIATVNQEEATVKFAENVLDQVKQLGLRATIDNGNESVGKKIRDAEIQKVPYTLVIGEKEVSGGQVVPRVRQDIEVQEENTPIDIKEFLGTVANESKSRVSRTSMNAYEAHKKSV